MYVVILFEGGHGDDVRVFLTEAEADECCVEYAREHWDASQADEFEPEPCPDADKDVLSEFVHGAFDHRFDVHEVEVPGLDAFVKAAEEMLAIYERTGDHDHDGYPYPGDCVACQLRKQIEEFKPKS